MINYVSEILMKTLALSLKLVIQNIRLSEQLCLTTIPVQYYNLIGCQKVNILLLNNLFQDLFIIDHMYGSAVKSRRHICM